MDPAGSSADRAGRGSDALYPFTDEEPFGTALLGGERRGPTLDDLVVVPPLFTPERLDRIAELGREPTYADVDLTTEIGGFPTTMPLTVAAMGSTDVANRHGPAISRGAARAGLILAIGENVATLRGYDERRDPDQPCLKERAFAYLDALPEDGHGGLVFQRSVEDAEGELWNRIHADPDFAPHLQAGRIGFEIKAGQGAKPGLGGVVRVPRRRARELAGTYHFAEDPDETEREVLDRHSAPGTYTPDILANMLRLMQNNYPRARVWLKLGPFRDVAQAVRVAADAGVDAITIDGAEGGTAMAPRVTLDHAGLPTLACLARLDGRSDGPDLLSSGGVRTGADVLKCLCLGSSGCAAGSAFVAAAREAGADGVRRYAETVAAEVRMLASALGRYRLADLGRHDVAALRRDVARALDVAWVMEGRGGSDGGA